MARAFFDFSTPGRFVTHVGFREVATRAPSYGFRACLVRAHCPLGVVLGPYDEDLPVVFPFARFVIVGALADFFHVCSDLYEGCDRVCHALCVEEEWEYFSAVWASFRVVSEGVYARSVLCFCEEEGRFR